MADAPLRFSRRGICALILTTTAMLLAVAVRLTSSVPFRLDWLSSILGSQERGWAVPRVDTSGHVVTRSILRCPRGECLIEHYSDPETTISDFRSLQNGDFVEFMFDRDSPWFAGQDQGRCSSNFNCCAFAVGDLVGLTPSDWLGTEPTSDSYASPMAVILDSYFSLVAEFTADVSVGEEGYESASGLCDLDVVCFERPASDGNLQHRIFNHAGQVRKSNGVNRLLCKFGQGPILLTDLRFPGRIFPGATMIRVYRFRS